MAAAVDASYAALATAGQADHFQVEPAPRTKAGGASRIRAQRSFRNLGSPSPPSSPASSARETTAAEPPLPKPSVMQTLGSLLEDLQVLPGGEEKKPFRTLQQRREAAAGSLTILRPLNEWVGTLNQSEVEVPDDFDLPGLPTGAEPTWMEPAHRSPSRASSQESGADNWTRPTLLSAKVFPPPANLRHASVRNLCQGHPDLDDWVTSHGVKQPADFLAILPRKPEDYKPIAAALRSRLYTIAERVQVWERLPALHDEQLSAQSSSDEGFDGTIATQQPATAGAAPPPLRRRARPVKQLAANQRLAARLALSLEATRAPASGSTAPPLEAVSARPELNLSTDEQETRSIQLWASKWADKILGDPACSTAQEHRSLPESWKPKYRAAVAQRFLTFSAGWLRQSLNAYEAWEEWLEASGLLTLHPGHTAAEPRRSWLDIYLISIRDTRKASAALRAYDGLRFAKARVGLFAAVNFDGLKLLATATKLRALNQATPLEIKAAVHMDSWLTSRVLLARGFAATAQAALHGAIRLVHVSRTHIVGGVRPDGSLFLQASKGKAKPGGAPTPMPWTLPGRSLSGLPLGQILYDFVKEIGRLEGVGACLFPAVRLRKGAPLVEATGFFRAAMKPADLMRHFQAFLQPPPLSMTAEEAAEFTTYCFRRFLTTLADLLGWLFEQKVAIGDWQDLPDGGGAGGAADASLAVNACQCGTQSTASSRPSKQNKPLWTPWRRACLR